MAFDLSEVWFFTARHNTGVEDGLAGYKGPAKYNMYGYPSPPPAQPKNARFNAYGQLFVSCNVQPYLRTYEYNTAVSGMTTPHKEVSILSPVPVNNLDSFSFSTDGNTVCLSSASTLMVYRKSGESYELLEDISNMAEGSIYSSTISSDGTYLFYTDAGGLHILKAQDSAYTQEASLDIQLTNLLLSSDDKYLIGSIVSNNKYYRHIYKCTIT